MTGTLLWAIAATVALIVSWVQSAIDDQRAKPLRRRLAHVTRDARILRGQRDLARIEAKQLRDQLDRGATVIQFPIDGGGRGA